MALKQEHPAKKPKHGRFLLKAAPLAAGLALLVSCTAKWKRDKDAGTPKAIAAATEKAEKISLDAAKNCTAKAEIYFRAGMDAEAAQVADDCNDIYLGMGLRKVKVTVYEAAHPEAFFVSHGLPKKEDFRGWDWWAAPINLCLHRGNDAKLGDIYLSRGE